MEKKKGLFRFFCYFFRRPCGIKLIYKQYGYLLEVIVLSVRERLLALKIKEKLDKNPEYAKKIGVCIKVVGNENVGSKKQNY